jgi:predicted outer membrane repeat protein
MRGCSHSVQQLHAVTDARVPPPPLSPKRRQGSFVNNSARLGGAILTFSSGALTVTGVRGHSRLARRT